MVAGGDFNMNLNLAQPGPSDLPGVFRSGTNTVDEHVNRYTEPLGSSPGPLSAPRVRRGANALTSVLTDAWAAAPVRSVRQHGVDRSPESTSKQLDSGGTRAGSEEYAALLKVADGNSLGKARIDGILTSGLVAETATVDWDAGGSDHRPVASELAFETRGS